MVSSQFTPPLSVVSPLHASNLRRSELEGSIAKDGQRRPSGHIRRSGAKTAADTCSRIGVGGSADQALLDRVKRTFIAIGPTDPPVSTAEFIANTLSTRLSDLAYDLDNGSTFDLWFSRYEDVISKDGATLDDSSWRPRSWRPPRTPASANFCRRELPKSPWKAQSRR